MRRIAIWVLLLVAGISFVRATPAADRRPLEHSDYERWNRIGSASLSHNGQWVAYSVVDGKRQSTLKVRRLRTDREYTIARGVSHQFSFDSQYLVFRVSPDPELLKRLQREKKKPEEMPGDELRILHLESGRMMKLDRPASFAMPTKQAGWLAVLLSDANDDQKLAHEKASVKETYQVTAEGLKRPLPAELLPKIEKEESTSQEKEPPAAAAKPVKATPGSAKEKEEPPTNSKKKEKKSGATLVLRHLASERERRFPHVTEFEFSKPGNLLAFATSDASNPQGDGVWVLDLTRDALQQISSGLGNYRQLAVDEAGRQLSFASDRDDYASDEPNWSLYLWQSGQKEALRIAAEGVTGLSTGWRVSPMAGPRFSEDGHRLYFNAAPKPEPPPQEDPDAEPQALLDLWHWQDPELQPQQLLRAEVERNRSYVSLYDVRAKKIIPLANPSLPTVRVELRSTADIALGFSDEPYRKLSSWEGAELVDVYLVNLRSGEAEKILERQRQSPSLSPGGKFLIWWDSATPAWWSLATEKPSAGERPKVQLTQGVSVPFSDELHDEPSDPPTYGIAGWTPDDEFVLLYDRYDIWMCDPTGKSPARRVTKNGRENRLRFRYERLDLEERYIDPSQPLILEAFDETTKASGYFRWQIESAKSESGESSEPVLEPLLMLDESVSGLTKAKETDDVILVRSTFQRSPDLWSSTLAMKSLERVSRINPQQNDCRWGSVELVHWKAADGSPRDGLLYRPDDFDPGHKYPLLVYFYERYSDTLHRYYPPAAESSRINISFYVSRGYVVFVPDIIYKSGAPGRSAADSVLPGVQHVIDQGFIDRDRMGMQGHSWGGYQSAYLLTQTDLFACAEAGAPVSNMTSAYGGIRWETGKSRMFQYEKTQSRIGRTLWEAPELYIQNSPLFHADKIRTPLLILHNDEDGAVPWYQGIELFVALRRLERPAWLLNYNGQPHGIVKEENRVDFARRMQQFFDHYLKGDPLPEWMAHGIPAVDKGRKFGFEYTHPPTAPANRNAAER